MSSDGLLPIVLIGHGRLASGLANAVEMIAGPQEAFAAVPLRPQDDVERVSRRLDRTIRRLGVSAEGEAVVFADLFGAAPANAAASLLRTRPNIEIVAGMNLPMVVEAVMAREGVSAREVAERAVESGREAVRDVGDVIRAALHAARARNGETT